MSAFNIDEANAGKRMPAICITLTGKTRAELQAELLLIMEQPHQLVEWRADYLVAAMKGKSFWNITREVLSVLGFLKSQLDVPVLFTIRTAREGGEAEIAEEDYFFINKMVADSGMAAMIDVEALASDSRMVREFVEYANDAECMIVSSNHDFDKTPTLEEMVAKYETMIKLGGHIVKLAVMPQEEEDVHRLLEAAAVINEAYPEQLMVAISMGELGRSSRICAGEVGSVITFAAGKTASAPGQIEAKKLQGYLEEYYK